MSSFYVTVPKMMIIWYTVPAVWRLRDVIVIFHFGPFFALLPSYANLPKKLKLKKKKKNPGGIIILNKSIKNHDHMQYCSLDMPHDRCNFYFSFWLISLPFHHPNSLKNQNLKKMKHYRITEYTCLR